MAFIVRKEDVGSIIICTPISIRISVRPHNITVDEDEEIEQFYEQLGSIIEKTPKKDILEVQRDWNARVEPDAYHHWAGTVGRFGTGETNDRIWGLLVFTKRHRLTLANTVHSHKLYRTATWHEPNGQAHNQTDFILTPFRFKSSINKANTK